MAMPRWSAAGRHTSHTDLELTDDGEREARAPAPKLADWSFAAVLSSPRLRAMRTAELAGLTVTTVDDDLTEWDYGQYEGVTTTEIRRRRPNWSLWDRRRPRRRVARPRRQTYRPAARSRLTGHSGR
jgi:probable phosphoglycerate mutase